MYAKVKLLNGFKELLTYKLPDSWSEKDLLGSIIEVPLQKRFEPAIIEEIFQKLDPAVTYTVRTATTTSIVPSDSHYNEYIKKLSAYYALDTFSLLKRLRSFLKEKEVADTYHPVQETEIKRTTLTKEQQAIVSTLGHAINARAYYPALLHGVTGSGKTEIYKQAIEQCWAQQKSTLFLVPEVTLAVQFTQRLKEQLSAEIAVFGFHSATSIKEKRALWQHLKENKPALIIGVHLPVLLPISTLGLIIIDEEHDPGFQEKKHPKINTKEAAFLRAQISSIPIIAGSATPSISSLYNVEHRGWKLFSLPKRFAGAFPRVSVIKLTNKIPRAHFWISKELANAIKAQLEKREQTIIFLNRRGYSFCIQCKNCGWVPHCNSCSVSLTLHGSNTLICHYCSFSMSAPESCGSCKSTAFIKKGIGTQQVVSILEKLFPSARIARADLDTTINKKQWTKTVKEFEEGAYDILVGTQTITKGYHFPKVTLVGILWADINLSLPLYNAAETTLQQLIQVAGRAGRQSPESHVIVQTMIDHPIFKYLNETDYGAFYSAEIENRRLVSYPPITRLVELELKHADEHITHKEAEYIAQSLKKIAQKKNIALTILGPAQPPVHKIKNVFSRKLYIKAQSIADIHTAYTLLDTSNLKCSLHFAPNPLN